MATTSAAIWRALVATLRAKSDLKAALTGGIHESFAPEPTAYPFVTYQPVASPYEDDWSSRLIVALVDVFVYSRGQVEARNLDQLVADALDGVQLTVDGQTTLISRRISDVPMPPDVDDEGKKIYQVGGSYEIWTDQARA